LPSCEADDNAIADPGFEGGADNDAWSAGSEQFASPICDASCVTSGAAGPAAGQWWVWFGGDQENEENAYVSQDVVIPSDGDGTLRFMFAINGAGELDASDTFDVSIDGANVFAASGANMGDYPDYTLVTVDVGDFADDASHTLRFDAHFEPGGLTSFFLDEVYMCGTPAAGTTGSTGDESGTSGTDGTTGATGTDTDTDTDTEGTTAGTTDESGSTGTTGGTTAAT
jgi:hypothetical protein